MVVNSLAGWGSPALIKDMNSNSSTTSLKLKAGEWVEVRSAAEILATLDRNGRIDGLPVMPQMLQYCGQRFRVRKRAHKLCDTAYATGARKMSNAVFLDDLRCDGKAFDACEMNCTIFWKEAWLKRSEPAQESTSAGEDDQTSGASPNPPEEAQAKIWAATRTEGEIDGRHDISYICQATQILEATRPLPRWELGQYIEDYISRNARLSQIMAGLIYVVYSTLVDSGLGFGSALRWLYDNFQKVRGGPPYPARRGNLPLKSKTPTANLNLQVGELVRIRDYRQILDTVDEQLVNRGMSFHPEMVPHCGKVFRVQRRLKRIMNERTGKIMELKNPCLVLEGADCIGRYTKPLNCPRASNPYWREIWLERVGQTTGTSVE